MAAGHGRIFISYRRSDTRYLAGRLYDTLAARFGGGQVFMDVDAIEPGLDFVEEITSAVAACDILLALIGPSWLTATDRHGRRLDNPNDFVRIELETALTRGIRLIPVLTDDAALPHPNELPEQLGGLARRQAVTLRHDRYHDDTRRLLTTLEAILAPLPTGDAPGRRPAPEEPKAPPAGGSSGLPDAAGEPAHELAHDEPVQRFVFSPDSAVLATASHQMAHLWDLASGEERHRLPHDHPVAALAFSPDGSLLATTSSACAHLWDPATGRERHRLPHGPPAAARSASLTGPIAAAAPATGELVLASHDDPPLWPVILVVPGVLLMGAVIVVAAKAAQRHLVSDLAFSPDGSLLATTTRETLRLWDPATGRELRRIPHHTPSSWSGRPRVAAAFSPDGAVLATIAPKAVHLWDPASGEERHRLPHDQPLAALAFSPDGSLLATVSHRTLHLWDPRTGRERHRLPQPWSSVAVTVMFSPDSRLLATTGARTTRLWDPAAGEERHSLRHDHAVTAAAFSPDSSLLATTSGRTVRLWDSVTSHGRHRLEHHAPVTGAVFGPDGSPLATTTSTSVSLWDPITGRQRDLLRASATNRLDNRPTALGFSPDGALLAVAGRAVTRAGSIVQVRRLRDTALPR